MMFARDCRKEQKRITWTSFHLPSRPSAATPGGDQTLDLYLGVLSNVPGVENVRLARRVEDVEQAAYIIVWSSADALASFQTSSVYPVFLDALGRFQITPSEATYTSPARTVSLQHDHGFSMDPDLHGRVTVNKFTGLGTWESWHEGSRNAFGGFSPLGCEDITRKRPPMYRWGIAWVEQQGDELLGKWRLDEINRRYETYERCNVPMPVEERDELEAQKKVIPRGDEHVRERWEILRWNEPNYYRATREREEESTKQPGARQHWEQAVQRYMPPAQTWVQERWDIEKPHSLNTTRRRTRSK